MIRLILNTKHPMFIWWGPDLIQFYNDAYRRTMGPERHPSALGGRGRECWAEIWDFIGPQIEHVMDGQGSTWDEDRLVPVTRHGSRQDVWWTYSYSPIDFEGIVGGVLVICNDVTTQHLATQGLLDQMQRLKQLFEEAPSFIAVLTGPDHVFEISNAAYKSIIGAREFIGRPLRDVVPELAGQGFFELLDKVYKTGEAHVARRMPLKLSLAGQNAPKEMVLDFVYQPIFDGRGQVSGIFVEGTDVTEHMRAESRLRILNEELKHRVKNTIAVVSAIAGQTLRNSGMDEKLDAFRARLVAFGRAHDLLTASNWASAPVRDIVNDALIAHRTGTGRFSISGPDVIVGSQQALSLSLAIHELATNAIKHGALSTGEGRVNVAWSLDTDSQREFHFLWEESGGPAVSVPDRKGFGSQLLTRILAGDFGAEVKLSYNQSGFVCRMTAPETRLGSSDAMTSH
jgi:two-component sensor histidine kinase